MRRAMAAGDPTVVPPRVRKLAGAVTQTLGVTRQMTPHRGSPGQSVVLALVCGP